MEGRRERVPDVAVRGDGRLVNQRSSLEVLDQPEVLGLGPDERPGEAGWLAVDEADGRGLGRRAVAGRGHVRVFPGLLGDESQPGGHVLHGLQELDRAGGLPGLEVLLGTLTVEQRPGMPGPGGGREPGRSAGGATGRVRDVAVTVAIGAALGLHAVAVPAGSRGGLGPDDGVNHLQRRLDVGIGGRELAQAGQLQESGVDDGALVHLGQAPVAEGVALGCVRVPLRGQPDEVAAIAVGPGAGHRPSLDVALVVVGRGQVQGGPRRVARRLGQVRGGDQAGDLSRDGRR